MGFGVWGSGFGVWFFFEDESDFCILPPSTPYEALTELKELPTHKSRGLGFGVWGLGFGVWGLGFGVWGLGFGVWGLGFGVWGLGFGWGGGGGGGRVQNGSLGTLFRFRVQDLGSLTVT